MKNMGTDYKKFKLNKVLLLFALLIMTSCGGEMITERDYDPELIQKAEKAYESQHWKDRMGAVYVLKEFAQTRARARVEKTLLKAADDVHFRIRVEAIKGLELTHSPEAVEKIRTAAESKNTAMQWQALKSLISINDPDAGDLYIKGMSHEDWLIRETCAKGICNLAAYNNRNKYIPYIISGLKDKSTSVVLATLTSLKFADAGIYPHLLEIFKKNSNRNNRMLETVITALYGYRLDKNTRSSLIKLLTHPNTKIRIASLRTLKEDQRLKEEDED